MPELALSGDGCLHLAAGRDRGSIERGSAGVPEEGPEPAFRSAPVFGEAWGNDAEVTRELQEKQLQGAWLMARRRRDDRRRNFGVGTVFPLSKADACGDRSARTPPGCRNGLPIATHNRATWFPRPCRPAFLLTPTIHRRTRDTSSNKDKKISAEDTQRQRPQRKQKVLRRGRQATLILRDRCYGRAAGETPALRFTMRA